MAIATPPTGVSNAELIRWAFGQLNRLDVSGLRQFWTADTVQRFPDRTCHGPDEIARTCRQASGSSVVAAPARCPIQRC